MSKRGFDLLILLFLLICILSIPNIESKKYTEPMHLVVSDDIELEKSRSIITTWDGYFKYPLWQISPGRTIEKAEMVFYVSDMIFTQNPYNVYRIYNCSSDWNERSNENTIENLKCSFIKYQSIDKPGIQTVDLSDVFSSLYQNQDKQVTILIKPNLVYPGTPKVNNYEKIKIGYSFNGIADNYFLINSREYFLPPPPWINLTVSYNVNQKKIKTIADGHLRYFVTEDPGFRGFFKFPPLFVDNISEIKKVDFIFNVIGLNNLRGHSNTTWFYTCSSDWDEITDGNTMYTLPCIEIGEREISSEGVYTFDVTKEYIDSIRKNQNFSIAMNTTKNGWTLGSFKFESNLKEVYVGRAYRLALSIASKESKGMEAYLNVSV
ncbi:MAG: hypothetical protein KJ767_02640 [Nanoarchaeota archaeon]|nr:hypothetical protein [Nanoarchaeota archaeon]